MGPSGPSITDQPGAGWLRWETRRDLATPNQPTRATWPERLLSGAVRQMDAVLRRRQGIIEYTRDPLCILRVSAHAAEHDCALRDRLVRRGDPIGEIHFWNEHILPMGHGGANVLWGASMRRRLRRSLARLATFVESDERFTGIDLFRGEVAFGPGKDLDRTRCFAEGFGFEITNKPEADGVKARMEAVGHAIFLWGMIRTFNPGALRSFKRLSHPTWLQLWISRDTLRNRYGAGCENKLALAQ